MELTSVQFADDCTSVILTDNEYQMEKVMEISLKQYHTYFAAQGMKLNMSKEKTYLTFTQLGQEDQTSRDSRRCRTP